MSKHLHFTGEKNMKLFVSGLWVLGVLFSQALSAGTVFDVETVSDTGAKRQGAIYVQNGKLSMDSVQPGVAMTLMYHSEPERAILVDHLKQTYVLISAEEATRLARQVNAAKQTMDGLLKFLPAEQQKAMKEVLKGQGVPDLDAELPAIEVIARGEGELFKEKKTARYDISEDGVVANRLWIASWEQFPESEQLKSTLLSASKFVESIARELPAVASKYQGTLGSLEKMGGMPVQLERFRANSQREFSSQVTGVRSADVAEATFNPPKGYTLKELPKLPF